MWRLIRFLIAGTAAVVVNVGVLFLLTHYGHVWYLFSAVASFLAAFVVSFFMQKFWTFADARMHVITSQAIKYGLIQGWDLILNLAALYALVTWGHLWYLLSQIIVAAVIAVQNFILYRIFIFTDLEQRTAHET